MEWENVTFSAGNSTAFGIYDNQQSFVTDSVKIIKYVIRSLGYPTTAIQLTPQHIMTSLQSATMKYSTLVNQSKIGDNMLNVIGGNPNDDLTKAAIYQNMGSVFQISQLYAQQSIIRNSLHVPIYSSSIKLQSGIQQYDLSQVIPHYTNSNVQILQIYYYPRTHTNYGFDANMPGFNLGSVMSQFGGTYYQTSKTIIMPVFQTLLRMQAVQLSQQVRRANFGFQLRHNKILFYPRPTQQQFITVQYILKTDKYANSIKSNVINNISNFPINTHIRYTDINMPGRNWIQRYTLALSKQILGVIRSKYSSIPYPQGETSLDGDTLRAQSSAQKEALIQQLKGVLQQTSMSRLIQKKKDMSQNLQTINSKVPLRIYIG